MNKIKKILKNRIVMTVFLSLIIFIITLLLPSFFIILDKKISYYFLKSHNENFSVSKDILIVELDEYSITKM
jgi:CHASE2 domain-containing sensor protein